LSDFVTIEDVRAARARIEDLIVLHIGHDRALSRARLGETEVEPTLETSGPDRVRSIKNHLQSARSPVEDVPHR